MNMHLSLRGSARMLFSGSDRGNLFRVKQGYVESRLRQSGLLRCARNDNYSEEVLTWQ